MFIREENGKILITSVAKGIDIATEAAKYSGSLIINTPLPNGYIDAWKYDENKFELEINLGETPTTGDVTVSVNGTNFTVNLNDVSTTDVIAATIASTDYSSENFNATASGNVVTFMSTNQPSKGSSTLSFTLDTSTDVIGSVQEYQVYIDMTLAKDIRKDQLRTEREPLLKELDALYIEMKSQERDLDSIKTRQAYLRDITDDSAFDSATTVEDLNAITISSWTPPTSESLGICDFHRTEVINNVTLTYDQMMIGVKHTTPVTITLPEINGAITTYSIKDESGNANTNNITIVPSGSDTIENSSSFTMNNAFQAIKLYSNGSGLWLHI